MGQKQSKTKKLDDAVLEELKKDSFLPKKTINYIYAKFMKRHPDGKITETDFQRTFTKCVRSGNPEIFRTCAFCSDKEIGFREFLLAVKMSSLGCAKENTSAIKQTFIEVIGCLPDNYYEPFFSGVQQLVERKKIAKRWVTDLKKVREKSVERIDLQTNLLSFLKQEVFDIIRRFFVGDDTSDETCLSTILKGVGEALDYVGYAGRILGAFLALKFKIGLEIPAIFCAVAVTISALILIRLIKKWVSLLMNKEIENAYALFGTDASASDDKIESCYRKRARKYHPDKGGDIVKWIQLQHAIALIRDARSKA
ncbi:uncharacterized protein LOC127862688 [Dreissena polymorpha]|uniref:J domain-containing protein n=1 Tax=Dreissena polymorpha TaxID=45954 RepID=A0A9D4BKK9_DREPO|nr:uncharacterized protein LOC127862688 [Dreissena polymorpha]XP_052257890.1 uncharacterized protein LOC127862688 [Dreissena polymorpha]XP_052257891.1 uncharacterized protein LOC127862688 [Dreissena polymorpha]XP_052257892.1 uncharacterized protein LOC127862688 [Dreissena polymorpha]XP_052257893.1 uncharacterized protein LOC127862688 [Dreissena polymorpha]XP_052257894.1 uncharacterized protein LOC127862688 [Dreissena polymorpha]KAH3698274.1 hypothetical protein DPMN_085793 [Dreissena polymorp